MQHIRHHQHITPVLLFLAVALRSRGAGVQDTSVQTLRKDTVMALRGGNETVEIAVEEQRFGIADDLNDVVFMRPGVGRIPEAGSSLLVNGESPFDNRYVVCGVPMFTASHFGNHIFADITGLPITTLKTVSIATRNLSGRYADATGAVVAFAPEVYRPSNPRWKPRPELALNAGNYVHDLSFSVPVARGAQLYQLTLNHVRDYAADWLGATKGVWEDPSLFGYAVPSAFYDAVLIGSQRIGALELAQTFWYAGDIYDSSLHYKGGTIPWGMSAVSASWDGTHGRATINAGLSRQRHYEGKRLGTLVPCKAVERSNAVVTGGVEQVVLGPGRLDVSGIVQYIDWSGTINARWYRIDTLATGVDTTLRQCDTLDRGFIVCEGPLPYELEETDSLVAHAQRAGRETDIRLHAGWQKWNGRIGYGCNLLAGGLLPHASLFLDPGLWAKYGLEKILFDVNAGVQTFRPDIRGMPDMEYRAQQGKAIRGSAGAQWDALRWLDVDVETYVKWKNRCPRYPLVPGALYWEPNLATPLLARGVNIELAAEFLDVIGVQLLQSFAWSDRVESDTLIPYEFDVPWSTKTLLSVRNRVRTFGLYLTGLLCAGLPYHELYARGDVPVFSSEVRRMPIYRRVDLKLQFGQSTEGNRWLTRFEVYLDFPNILNFFEGLIWYHRWVTENTREYYWDQDFVKRPVTLSPYSVSAGLRLGFRL